MVAWGVAIPIDGLKNRYQVSCPPWPHTLCQVCLGHLATWPLDHLTPGVPGPALPARHPGGGEGPGGAGPALQGRGGRAPQVHRAPHNLAKLPHEKLHLFCRAFPANSATFIGYEWTVRALLTLEGS